MRFFRRDLFSFAYGSLCLVAIVTGGCTDDFVSGVTNNGFTKCSSTAVELPNNLNTNYAAVDIPVPREDQYRWSAQAAHEQAQLIEARILELSALSKQETDELEQLKVYQVLAKYLIATYQHEPFSVFVNLLLRSAFSLIADLKVERGKQCLLLLDPWSQGTESTKSTAWVSRLLRHTLQKQGYNAEVLSFTFVGGDDTNKQFFQMNSTTKNITCLSKKDTHHLGLSG